MSQIDFFDALRRGLLNIALQEPCGDRTDQEGSARERRAARVRTELVPEVSMSLVEFVAATEPSNAELTPSSRTDI